MAKQMQHHIHFVKLQGGFALLQLAHEAQPHAGLSRQIGLREVQQLAVLLDERSQGVSIILYPNGGNRQAMRVSIPVRVRT